MQYLAFVLFAGVVFAQDHQNVKKVPILKYENGFQPQGAHLPVPPAVPEAIVRSLEWNAAHHEEEEEYIQTRFHFVI